MTVIIYHNQHEELTLKLRFVHYVHIYIIGTFQVHRFHFLPPDAVYSKLHQRHNRIHQQTRNRYDNSTGCPVCDDGCYIAVC